MPSYVIIYKSYTLLKIARFLAHPAETLAHNHLNGYISSLCVLINCYLSRS